MTEFNRAKNAAKILLEDLNNNNIKVTVNMETNQKTTKILDHEYSVNSPITGCKGIHECI